MIDARPPEVSQRRSAVAAVNRNDRHLYDPGAMVSIGPAAVRHLER
jgi:hypothetical protein